MYKDMFMKLKFHKEIVIKNLLKKGIYPSNELISQEVSDLDNRLALFKSYVYQPGEKLNVKELNHNIEMIHKDITILYELLYDLSVNEYAKLYNYVESHLNNLENTVDKYVKRAEEETNSTTLGKTLLFQSNSFDIENHDDQISIDLGTLSLFAGSKIACFANINNVTSSNIKFDFNHVDVEKNFNVLAYNHNSDFAIVPGIPNIARHEIKYNENFKPTQEIKLDSLTINSKNDYDMYAGKNKVVIKELDTGKESYHDFPTASNPIKLKKRSQVTFYLLDGEKLEYTFNMKPLHTNFSLANSEVNINNETKKIHIDGQENFTFYFEINKGNAFAIKEQGVIKNNSLYYYGPNINSDMQVREYKKDTPINYNVKAIIQSEDISDIVIDSIYIKEL